MRALSHVPSAIVLVASLVAMFSACSSGNPPPTYSPKSPPPSDAPPLTQSALDKRPVGCDGCFAGSAPCCPICTKGESCYCACGGSDPRCLCK